jgi:hypothetical protein
LEARVGIELRPPIDSKQVVFYQILTLRRIRWIRGIVVQKYGQALGLVRPKDWKRNVARIVGFRGLGVRRGRREVDIEIVLYLVIQPKQEADEDDDFEDDEFDLSQPVAELG